MTWKVDPTGVQSVLSSVSTESQTVFEALAKVDGAVEGAAKGAQSQMIVSALSEFFGAMKPHITAMENRIPAACDGAAAATMAIMHGDEQMALDAEHNATTVAVNGNFSVFGGTASGSGGGK
ncbi:MAG: hypothetical protein JWP75_1650 [Frondihabitans sp.]|nr:hypothetical protein [Frondihabitans sp.]